jgi:hypothetical protein
MVFLVEILTLWARARNFAFLMNFADSMHASNSKLDVLPVESESRVSAKEVMIGLRMQTVRPWLSSMLQCPKGRLGGLGWPFGGYQMRTGGYDWI